MVKRLDEKDLVILRMLEDNARVSKKDIAGRVGLTATAVLERIRKLEERGFIQAYTAILDYEKIGLGIMAYVLISDSDPSARKKTGAAIEKIPGVVELTKVTGRFSFIAKVRVASTSSLASLIENELGRIKAISATESVICLDSVVDFKPALTHFD